MNTIRSFSADSNKLAYAQAFSRASSQRLDRVSRGERRRPLTLRRNRKPAA